MDPHQPPRVPRVTSQRLSLASKDGCSIEKDVCLSSGPESRHRCLEAFESSHLDVRKAARTFGNRVLSRRIQLRYEAATELSHLGESVRLAALVNYAHRGSFLDVECVRFEVPARVPAAAFANKSDNVVNALSVTFLQKSGPSAALKVAGSVDVPAQARRSRPRMSNRQRVKRTSLRYSLSLLPVDRNFGGDRS